MVESTQSHAFWPTLAEPFRQLGQKVADWFSPASEASSSDDAYRISVELPGVALDNIDITLKDDVLTVTGTKETHAERKTETLFFSERTFGSFRRSFRLPPDADGEKINAAYTDGVLSLTVPRRDMSATGARKIAVRSA